MTFKEFKNNVNIIESAEELQGWEFDRFLTTLQNVIDAIVGKKVGED
jgi:hypothetical protein